MRMPRRRSLLTGSGTPWMPQSTRPVWPSPETKSRFLKTETSLCEAGQTNVITGSGLSGFEMSNTWKPL